MEVLVEGLKTGKKFPKQVKVWKLNKYEMVDFNDLNEYQKEREVQIAIVNTEGMIKSRQNWIKMMDALAVATLGTDLREVEQVAGPARIGSGEKKVGGSGRVLTSLYQDGARVYYNYTNDAGKVLKGWVGSAAWRKLLTPNLKKGVAFGLQPLYNTYMITGVDQMDDMKVYKKALKNAAIVFLVIISATAVLYTSVSILKNSIDQSREQRCEAIK
ncbi:hypothetical protein [Stenotrophomonas phage IME-SM1]|uniref:Uncharacterized protein n=1 Tax=Stenotrophomonas phage IME-SM1 TaxID=1654717 RepID=A0A0H4ISK0_9CAUD|nr:hypothetical protein KMC40_gp037 [Stenotrophomonas phage IME-SM1]AKO61721.1 hypothetical protein [Stenotrophomonas phage IME-SM1]